jgi:voltage-gated potassium channel
LPADPAGVALVHSRSMVRTGALLTRLDRARAGGAYDRFVDRTDNWMLALAVVFLGVLVWPLIDRDLPAWLDTAIQWADITIWVIFAVEYLIRLTLAPNRWFFVRTHIPDLIVVLVPPVRSLRVLIVLRMFRLLGVVSMASRLSRQSLQVRTSTYTALLALGVLFAGALTVLEVERNAPDANITSFEDALWWALTTMTTVGYGDRFPVTSQGRLMAAVLMMSGIAVLGVLTASIAAWFVGQFHTVESAVERVEREVADVAESIDDVSDSVDDVEVKVDGVTNERGALLAALRDISARLATLEAAVAETREERERPR